MRLRDADRGALAFGVALMLAGTVFLLHALDALTVDVGWLVPGLLILFGAAIIASGPRR